MRRWFHKVGVLGFLGLAGCGRETVEAGATSAAEAAAPDVDRDAGTPEAGGEPDAVDAGAPIIRVLSVERYDPGAATRYSGGGPVIDIDHGGGSAK